MNGSYGEVWVDSDYLAQAIGVEAKVTLITTDVMQCGTLAKGTKVTGIEGKGTLKLNHVDSYFVIKMSECIKNGKAFRATVIVKLDDPESLGAERVSLTDCVFTELTLANWEAGKLGEESIPFTFSDYEVLESIEPIESKDVIK